MFFLIDLLNSEGGEGESCLQPCAVGRAHPTLWTRSIDFCIIALFDSVMNLDDLTRRGLYLSDIPLHDATRDLVLLGEQFREEYKLTQELEILTDRLQLTLRALEDEKKKTDT